MPSIMHRHQQKPHRNRAAASNHPNVPATTTTITTTPPSMKRLHLHRRACSSPSSPSSPSSSVVAPNGSSSSAIRSFRPPIHRRAVSAHYTPVHLNHHKKAHPRRLLGAASGPASQIVPEDDAQIEMAASFLQFCAMCEKQIMVPSNSVLYCSESCRRKDSCKPLSASTYTMTSSSPVNININHNHNHNLDQAGSPFSSTSTCRVSRSSRPLVSIPCDLHDAKSDLDPTEWKPIISRSRGRSSGRTSTSLASSEAWLFLSQFHHRRPSPADDESTKSISSSTPSSSSAATMHAVLPVRRTPTSRTSNFSSSSLSTMMSTTPSLVNTPTTITASSSVTGSPPQSLLSASSPPCPISAVDYIGAGTAYGYGYACTGFDLNPSKTMHPARPLPPRHNPSFSTSGAGASKGVHLVVPHIVTSVPVADDRHVGTADADDGDDVDVDVDDDVHGLRDEGVWMTM